MAISCAVLAVTTTLFATAPADSVAPATDAVAGQAHLVFRSDATAPRLEGDIVIVEQPDGLAVTREMRRTSAEPETQWTRARTPEARPKPLRSAHRPCVIVTTLING